MRPAKIIMKKPTLAAAFIALVLLSANCAQGQCRTRSIQKFAADVTEHFDARTLATLDQQRAGRGRIRVTIEHSLADDDDPKRFEVRRFSSLIKFEQWLKSRETDGMPGRYSREMKCSRGVCRANLDGGINHNSLYLKRMTYGISNGCPYLKTIYILDGD